MTLTAIDKIKITKYLKEHAIDDIYYLDLCDAIGKRGKVKDIEFLIYFTDCVVSEFRKNEKISIKQLTKLIMTIDSFLTWMNEENKDIDDKTLDIIRSFEDLYDDYLNRNNYDIDIEFTDNVIGRVLDTINKLYPTKSGDNESLGKYINQIADLEEMIKKLKRELEENNRLYDLLDDNYKKDKDRLSISQKDVIKLTREVKNKNKEIISLNERISSLTEEITRLEEQVSVAMTDLEYFRAFKDQYDKLLLEVERLNKIIEEDIREQTEKATQRALDFQMEAIIYEQLLFNNVNLDMILVNLKNSGYNPDRNQVYDLLKRIKSRINFISNGFSFTPSYKIVSPTINEHGEFIIDVPVSCKHYDIMLVSDFHIKDIDSKVLAGFDMLNNYCANNGVNLILNLGDFYHGTTGCPVDYDHATFNYRVVEKSISMIPRADGIYHAVLGGNHDRSILKYGFDPIGMLCSEREDFIDLGYSHSTISLNGYFCPLISFDIHHPDTFDFPIDLDDDGIDVSDINMYLDDLYSKQGRNRNESYIDVLGHTHKSQFNNFSGYCYIPSYFEGKSKRGACHLRIYFDEDTGVKYMVFMPLSISDKLIKNNEIIYQKILTK